MQPPTILEWQFYHNSLEAWLVAGVVFVVIGTTLVIIRTLLARRLAKIAARTATTADDAIVDLLRRTRYFFILTAAVAGAFLFLDLPPRAHSIGHLLGTISLILQIAIWGNGLITFWFQNYATRKADTDLSSRTTIAAFSFVARTILWIMLALVALNRLGYDVTALITGLGVGGIAIALAVQNVLGDLFAALAIVLDKPFVVGDSISVDTVTGTVEHVGLKTTRIRSVNGEQIICSNADLLRSRIRNFKRMQERRVVFTTGVSYETPPDTIAKIPAMLREAVEAQQQVRFDRSHFVSYGESALNFETVYFVLAADYLVYANVNQAVNLAVLRRFATEGIEFAYPTRVVFVKGDATAPSSPAVAAR
ncbi:MAG TPA: mechanosensitive ion channel family protein [Gemmatimonadaceae bacterium]|jgi:small-conductance mechanosensitive channel|nr:mechanosensitive ion channel family protein [Gemmatimonadaceae bacterium]